MYFVAMVRAGGRPHSGSVLPSCGAGGSRVPEDKSSLAHPYMSEPNPLSLDQRLLTAQDVADLLSVPRSSVYEYARRRRTPLPSIPVGRHRRFHRSDVETWLVTCQRPTASGSLQPNQTPNKRSGSDRWRRSPAEREARRRVVNGRGAYRASSAGSANRTGPRRCMRRSSRFKAGGIRGRERLRRSTRLATYSRGCPSALT
jgi:excisionase family DNA binding protein